jgi:hypothetical protein
MKACHRRTFINAHCFLARNIQLNLVTRCTHHAMGGGQTISMWCGLKFKIIDEQKDEMVTNLDGRLLCQALLNAAKFQPYPAPFGN